MSETRSGQLPQLSSRMEEEGKYIVGRAGVESRSLETREFHVKMTNDGGYGSWDGPS